MATFARGPDGLLPRDNDDREDKQGCDQRKRTIQGF
jgi:hypothetical protein